MDVSPNAAGFPNRSYNHRHATSHLERTLAARGLLLPLLARELGLWPGIAVATGLYVLAHLARPAAESLAAIPAGFIMAAITLVTGSILAAIVLHWIIASVNETVSAVREKKGTRIF